MLSFVAVGQVRGSEKCGMTLENGPETAQQCSFRKLPQILIRPEMAATGAIRGRSVVLESLIFIGLGVARRRSFAG